MSRRNRRQFVADMLKGSAIVGSSMPLSLFVDSIFRKALAQEETVNPRRLISFQAAQAPARWSYDMFLTPYMTDQELAAFDPGNQMIRTKFTGSSGRNDELVYSTVRLHGINAPAMWAFDVPRAGGGDRPQADLLLNMLSLQGINTTNAGHDISRRLHFLPAGASQSVGALSSDYTPFPLGTLGAAANYMHLSKFGKSPLVPGSLSGNYLDQLLRPFILSLASSRLDSSSASATSNYQRLNRILDSYAKQIDDRALSSIANKSNAHELMLDGFGDLAAIWTSRTAVYNDLIRRALTQTTVFPGFNDKPLGPADIASRSLVWAMNTPANVVKYDDVNEMFNVATLTTSLAGVFTVAEYLTLNDLSSSVCMSIGALSGMKVTSGKNTDSSSSFDEHNTGAGASLISNFWFNRALSACLLELTDRLKAKTVNGTNKTYFEESVIEVHGDFQRSARGDGSGSDHGSIGKSVMYLSGAIDGPYVIGALGRAPSTAGAPGSWGQGAIDPVLGKQVTNAEMAATTANLLRVPSPFTTASPMALLQEDGSVTPIAIKTRIV
jgi:hypothetical protein